MSVDDLPVLSFSSSFFFGKARLVGYRFVNRASGYMDRIENGWGLLEFAVRQGEGG